MISCNISDRERKMKWCRRRYIHRWSSNYWLAIFFKFLPFHSWLKPRFLWFRPYGPEQWDLQCGRGSWGRQPASCFGLGKLSCHTGINRSAINIEELSEFSNAARNQLCSFSMCTSARRLLCNQGDLYWRAYSRYVYLGRVFTVGWIFLAVPSIAQWTALYVVTWMTRIRIMQV